MLKTALGAWLPYTLNQGPRNMSELDLCSTVSLEVSVWVAWKSILRNAGQILREHFRRPERRDWPLAGLALNVRSPVSGRAKSDFIVTMQLSPSY